MEVKGAIKKSPIIVRKTRDKNFIFETRLEVAIHKKRNHKAIAPDGDILPVAEELFGASFKGVDAIQDRLSSVSISGLLRALSIFRLMHPKEYKTLLSLMHLLSYSFDRNMAVPPLFLLQSIPIQNLEEIWRKVEELTGISKDKYCQHITKEFIQRELAEHYALFYPDSEDDEDAILTITGEIDDDDKEDEETTNKGDKNLAWNRIFPGLKTNLPMDDESDSEP